MSTMMILILSLLLLVGGTFNNNIDGGVIALSLTTTPTTKKSSATKPEVDVGHTCCCQNQVDSSSHDYATRRNWILQQFVGTTISSSSSLLLLLGQQPGIVNAQEEDEAKTKKNDQPYTVELQIRFDDKKDLAGTIEIEIYPEWAPLAAERFKELVSTTKFYDKSKFFRVLPNYVAQFGIASDPNLNKEWILCQPFPCRPLRDEPRLQSNRKGTLSFASSGSKNSRQTQVFINLSNNGGPPNFLDAQGFVPFGEVTKGLDLLTKNLNYEYGIKESLSGGITGSVNQGKAAYYGNEYLDAIFPNLSYIESAKIKQ